MVLRIISIFLLSICLVGFAYDDDDDSQDFDEESEWVNGASTPAQVEKKKKPKKQSCQSDAVYKDEYGNIISMCDETEEKESSPKKKLLSVATKANLGYIPEPLANSDSYIPSSGIGLNVGLVFDLPIAPKWSLLWGTDLDLYVIFSNLSERRYSSISNFNYSSDYYEVLSPAKGVHWHISFPVEMKFSPIKRFWIKSGMGIAVIQAMGLYVHESDGKAARWDRPLTDVTLGFVPTFLFGIGSSFLDKNTSFLDYGLTISYSLTKFQNKHDKEFPNQKYLFIGLGIVFYI